MASKPERDGFCSLDYRRSVNINIIIIGFICESLMMHDGLGSEDRSLTESADVKDYGSLEYPYLAW